MRKIVFALFVICFVFGFAGNVFAQDPLLIAQQKASILEKMRSLSMELCDIRKQIDETAAKWQALGFQPSVPPEPPGPNEMTQADINLTYNGLPLADVLLIIAAFGEYRTEMDTWSLQFRKIMP